MSVRFSSARGAGGADVRGTALAGGVPGAGLRLPGAGALLGGGVRFCVDDRAVDGVGMNVATRSRAGIQSVVAFMADAPSSVANDLTVRLSGGNVRTDTEIGQAAAAALTWSAVVPPDRVTVTVVDGWVTLNGIVGWQFQKEAAARAVRDLKGVIGVTNRIVLESPAKAGDVRAQIEAAFTRSAEVDARRITVGAHDGQVTLTGTVHSWAELREAVPGSPSV